MSAAPSFLSHAPIEEFGYVLPGTQRSSRALYVFVDDIRQRGVIFATWQIAEALAYCRQLFHLQSCEFIALGRPGEEPFWWITDSFSGGTTETFTTAGAGTWTVPSVGSNGFDVTSVNVEGWGGGGGGGNSSGIGGLTVGAGGGGGAYAKKSSITVTPGGSIPYNVGAGGGSAATATDTNFNGAAAFNCDGGTGGNNTTPGVGGSLANSVGDTKFAGGNGVAGSGTSGGGGGGGAGDAGTGNNASGATGGAARVLDGGAGGNGGAALTGGSPGSVRGGAGGGGVAL